MTTIFTEDYKTQKPEIAVSGQPIENPAAVISADVSDTVKQNGDTFSSEIAESIITDFEKPGDCMVHVSTFAYIGDKIYMTYYANTQSGTEDPNFQTARFVYCNKNDTENKTFLDIQSVGDDCHGGRVEMVYDTIMMPKDDDTVFILWTAKVDGNYYRLYRTFTVSTQTLGEVGVNRFKVGDITNDFSSTGIKSALAENGLGIKNMYSDIGIMQKLTFRMENGEKYYYSGAYSGDLNCIIKSKDFITWEYVSAPDFPNMSKWENAVYVLNDKVYYFVRQQDGEPCGFLTYYDLQTGKWATPVLIADCQSRSDFIFYKGGLYLFHAPVDRNHIGIVKIDTDDIKNSHAVLQADMQGSCFYPFVQYNGAGELCMSYTVSRKHIRLAGFTLSKYL